MLRRDVCCGPTRDMLVKYAWGEISWERRSFVAPSCLEEIELQLLGGDIA